MHHSLLFLGAGARMPVRHALLLLLVVVVVVGAVVFVVVGVGVGLSRVHSGQSSWQVLPCGHAAAVTDAVTGGAGAGACVGVGAVAADAVLLAFACDGNGRPLAPKPFAFVQSWCPAHISHWSLWHCEHL